MSIRLAGIIVFLLSILIGRLISERALAKLSGDQKQNLLDGLVRYRKYSLLPLIGALLAYGIAILLVSGYFRLFTQIFLVVIFLYVLISNILLLVRVGRLALPSFYRRAMLTARIINLLGIAALFFFLIQ